MGIRILKLRFRVAAPPEGCRWCGVSRHDHAQSWVPSRKWHGYETPTAAQIIARKRSWYNQNKSFLMPDTANPDRTRL